MKNNSQQKVLHFVSQLYAGLDFIYVFDQNIKSTQQQFQQKLRKLYLIKLDKWKQRPKQTHKKLDQQAGKTVQSKICNQKIKKDYSSEYNYPILFKSQIQSVHPVYVITYQQIANCYGQPVRDRNNSDQTTRNNQN